MEFHNIINGTVTDADKVMDNFNYNKTVASYGICLGGRNLIRQLMDRDVVLYDTGKLIEFADAYTSAGGRKGSVETRHTTSNHSSNFYENSWTPIAGDPIFNPDSFSDEANGFDGNTGTHAYKKVREDAGVTFNYDYVIGKTFSPTNIDIVTCALGIAVNASHCSLIGTTTTNTLIQYTLDGSTWHGLSGTFLGFGACMSTSNNLYLRTTSTLIGCVGLRARFWGSIKSVYGWAEAHLYFKNLQYGQFDPSYVVHNLNRYFNYIDFKDKPWVVTYLPKQKTIELFKLCASDFFGYGDINDIAEHTRNNDAFGTVETYDPFASNVNEIDLDIKRGAGTTSAEARFRFFYLDGTNAYSAEATTTSTTYVTETLANPHGDKPIRYIELQLKKTGGADNAYATNIQGTCVYGDDGDQETDWLEFDEKLKEPIGFRPRFCVIRQEGVSQIHGVSFLQVGE